MVNEGVSRNYERSVFVFKFLFPLENGGVSSQVSSIIHPEKVQETPEGILLDDLIIAEAKNEADRNEKNIQNILKSLDNGNINARLISKHVGDLKGTENEIVAAWLRLIGEGKIAISSDDRKRLAELSDVLQKFIPTATEKCIQKYLGFWLLGRNGELKGMFALREYVKRMMKKYWETISL